MNRSGLPGRRGADSIRYAPIEEAGMWSEPRAVRIALAVLLGPFGRLLSSCSLRGHRFDIQASASHAGMLIRACPVCPPRTLEGIAARTRC